MKPGPIQDRILNYMPQGTGLCYIHDLPISYTDEDAVAHETIVAMIKGFSVPGLNVKYQSEAHIRTVVDIPVQVENDLGDGMTFTITMMLDDRMDNWYGIYRYARTLISPPDGSPETNPNYAPYHPTKMQPVYAQRRMGVDLIEIMVGDGSDELFNIFKLKRNMLQSISGFEMKFGTDAEYVTFTTTWKCTNWTLERVKQDPNKPRAVNA